MEPLSILLVDDDADIGVMMRLRLAKEAVGMSFHFVEGGLECIEYLRAYPVDCILSDYQMPDMDGMELLLAIRGLGSDVPFIFVTGQGNEEVAREAFKNGAYDYFTKDMGFAHFTRIINSIEQAVKKRQADRELKDRDFWINEFQRVARIGSYVLDIQTGLWTCSDIMDEIFGIENSYNKTVEGWGAIIHPEDRDRMLQYFSEVLTQKKRFEADYSIVRHNDGQERWVSGLGELVSDKDGYPVKMIGTIQDITDRKRQEDALTASEKYLRTIIDTAPVCVKLITVEGIVLTMNPAGLAMIEADSLEQVKGRSVFGLIVPEYCEAFRALGEKVSKGGIGSLEFEMVGFKGKRLWLETRAVPLRNEKDEITALLCITLDIKERKLAEDALHDSEERFRTLFESADDGIFLVDESGFVDCNLKGAMMYGYKDKNELLGRNYLEFSPRVQPDGKNSEEENRRMVALVLSGEPQNFYWQSLHRDGSPFDVEVSLNCLYLKGKPYIQAIVRDITERKKMEEAVKFNNVLLSAQQEATLDGILAVDPDGKIISYNKRFIEIWNIPIPQEVEDTRSDELAIQSVLHHLKKPEEFLERVNHLYEHRTETCKDDIELNDGRTLDRYTAPMFGADGRYYGRVWYFRDITGLKDLERQRADFYKMVTHDLKSPLTTMLGYTSLISEAAHKKADDDIEEMSKSVTRGGEKLMRLVDDFLSAGMESGCIKVNPMPVDMAGVLKDVTKDFGLSARKKGIVFNVDIPDGLPLATVDKKHFERAVGNLLQNAFNYTPKGGAVTLKAVAPSDGQVRYITVSVSDTGPGIAPEERTKIFDKYYRSPGMPGIKGTGLGLAIVKAVAEAHGGRVELESEVGKGSTFRLILPIE